MLRRRLSLAAVIACVAIAGCQAPTAVTGAPVTPEAPGAAIAGSEASAAAPGAVAGPKAMWRTVELQAELGGVRLANAKVEVFDALTDAAFPLTREDASFPIGIVAAPGQGLTTDGEGRCRLTLANVMDGTTLYIVVTSGTRRLEDIFVIGGPTAAVSAPASVSAQAGSYGVLGVITPDYRQIHYDQALAALNVEKQAKRQADLEGAKRYEQEVAAQVAQMLALKDAAAAEAREKKRQGGGGDPSQKAARTDAETTLAVIESLYNRAVQAHQQAVLATQKAASALSQPMVLNVWEAHMLQRDKVLHGMANDLHWNGLEVEARREQYRVQQATVTHLDLWLNRNSRYEDWHSRETRRVLRNGQWEYYYVWVEKPILAETKAKLEAAKQALAWSPYPKMVTELEAKQRRLENERAAFLARTPDTMEGLLKSGTLNPAQTLELEALMRPPLPAPTTVVTVRTVDAASTANARLVKSVMDASTGLDQGAMITLTRESIALLTAFSQKFGAKMSGDVALQETLVSNVPATGGVPAMVGAVEKLGVGAQLQSALKQVTGIKAAAMKANGPLTAVVAPTATPVKPVPTGAITFPFLNLTLNFVSDVVTTVVNASTGRQADLGNPNSLTPTVPSNSRPAPIDPVLNIQPAVDGSYTSPTQPTGTTN